MLVHSTSPTKGLKGPLKADNFAVGGNGDMVSETIVLQFAVEFFATLQAMVDGLHVHGNNPGVWGSATDLGDVDGSHGNRIASSELGGARVENGDLGLMKREGGFDVGAEDGVAGDVEGGLTCMTEDESGDGSHPSTDLSRTVLAGSATNLDVVETRLGRDCVDVAVTPLLESAGQMTVWRAT